MVANVLKIAAFLFTGVVVAAALASDPVPATTEENNPIVPETTQIVETAKPNTQVNDGIEDLKQKQEALKEPSESKHIPTQDQDRNTTNIVPVAQKVKTEPEPVKNVCNPNYSGCLKIDAGDYDCAGGSGNGPNYTGPVQVYGSDPFDLDRDHDGWGCE